MSLWYSKESAGSSVVDRYSTLEATMSFRGDRCFSRITALAFSRMDAAVLPFKGVSMPKKSRSSMWVQ